MDAQVLMNPMPAGYVNKVSIMRDVTEHFAESTDLNAYSDKELGDRLSGCLTTSYRAYGFRNTSEGLPNPCIAMLILAKYHVRCISWTGRRDDGNFVGVYQDEGEDKGIYMGSDAYFNQLVRGFKFNATKKDVDEIYAILEADAPFVKPCEDQNLIAVNNGIFNYKMKTLMDFDPDIAFTRKSKVNYVDYPIPVNPHITMPDGQDWDFDSWLHSLTDDADIEVLLLHVIGAVIRPNVRWDKIVCMYSQVGMNGKGTLCELMKQLCGRDAYASISFVNFQKDSYLAQLITANAVITDENGTNDYAKNVSNLKALATGDSISIDRKYKSAITFRYNGLIVECVNNLPRAADQTDSFYRRFLMIPFDKTFKGQERKYIKSDYLHRPEVLEYVLYKVLNMPDYYELPEPEACKALLEEYKEYNDPVLQFVDEIFPELVWNKVPQSFVYSLYLEWCKRNNPSGKLIGKHSVIDKVKQYVLTRYSDTWMFCDAASINKTDNTEPEMLIMEYGLEDWKSTYTGVDPKKICMPDFKQSYRNVFVFIGSKIGKEDTV